MLVAEGKFNYYLQRYWYTTKSEQFYAVNSVLGSVTTPSTADAAATKGDANNVLDPGPCLHSKFLFEVETDNFPEGILSSFIAKQAEHPGSLNTNPASVIMVSNPSALI